MNQIVQTHCLSTFYFVFDVYLTFFHIFGVSCFIADKIAAELTYYNIQEVSFKGMYQCEISIKGDRRVRCLSSGAMLNVKVPQEIHNVEYNRKLLKTAIH